MSKRGKVIVSCAVTGSIHVPTQSPHLPITPAQIAENAIAAAEAGCYSMALSANLEKAGYPAKRINTTATVKLEMIGGGPKITTIDVNTEAEVPGIDEAKFREQAELTKKTCPVSVALAGTQINLDAKLV